MIKKLLRVSLISVLLILLLISIFKSIDNRNRTYDSEFITSLAKGLDERWKVNAQKDDDEKEIEDYKSYIDYELIEIEQYKNRKFKNPKLKRLANTYISIQRNEREAIENQNFVDSTFVSEWNQYQNKRFELLLDINSIVEIPVQDKNILDSILKSGKAVKEFNRVYGILVDTFDPKNFVVEEVTGVSGKEKRYIGDFENTTGHYINYIDISIDFYDENDKVYYGFRFNTRYVWENGTKKSFEFSIPDSDTRFKYFKVNLGEKSFSFE
ncbi:MAG: FxLYD domain-containing protein [Streptococcus salivarius]|uniref:FxLYD domain-containing protein n=1 Tax=Streptococcus sp. TaxID=1306 RepID=UPI00290C225D|nr:FxLYD domain-containing protein [Streptococcus sp.]MDU7942659.1 FxLYD domain-containing protein [Streptococcus salivarius]MDU8046041.1 FxLYD domain-containing protein [Streptococcus sp.]